MKNYRPDVMHVNPWCEIWELNGARASHGSLPSLRSLGPEPRTRRTTRRTRAHPGLPSHHGAGGRSPRARAAARTARRRPRAAPGHERQALQRGPRSHRPSRAHVERVQHLHHEGQRHAFPGQLRLRHRLLRPRPRTRCEAGAHGPRCGRAAGARVPGAADPAAEPLQLARGDRVLPRWAGCRCSGRSSGSSWWTSG